MNLFRRIKSCLKKIILTLINSDKPLDLDKKNKIMWIFRSKGWGDLFLSLYIPREIKKNTDCSLYFASYGKFCEFMQKDRNIDFFLPILKEYPHEYRLGIRNTLALLKSVSKIKPDLLFFMDWLPFHLVILFKMAGAKHIVCEGNELPSNNFIDYAFHISTERYVKEILADGFLKIFGKQPDIHCSFNIDRSAYTKAKEKISQANKKNMPFILFNTEGSSKIKSLSRKNIVSTVLALSRDFPGLFTLAICYKYDVPEIPYCENAAVIKCTDIHQLIAMAEMSAGIISVDTSVIHIADILRKPLTGLYQPSKGKISKYYQTQRKNCVNLINEKTINDISSEEISAALARTLILSGLDSLIKQ